MVHTEDDTDIFSSIHHSHVVARPKACREAEEAGALCGSDQHDLMRNVPGF